MPKHLTILLLLLLLSTAASAQIDRGKVAYNWVFGDNCSITFNTDDCEPVENALPNDYSAIGSTITHSDPDGNLMFYGGSFVFNAQHQLISNANIQANGNLQKLMLIPKPESLDTFYIFSISMYEYDKADRETYLKHSILDMSANGGLGAFIEMNQLVAPEIEEAMTATRHANGKDIWLIVHSVHSDLFNAYLITEDGIDPNPVSTNIGTASFGFNGEKYLKISPDGTLLAYVPQYCDNVNIMDFDNATGLLSNCMTLEMGSQIDLGFLSLQFSLKNRCFYTVNDRPAAGYALEQYNLMLPTPEEIVNSKVLLNASENNFCGDMQYGPNGTMYVCKNNTWFISAIKQPDKYGTACQFIDTAFRFQVPGDKTKMGFPQFIQSDLLPIAFTYGDACANSPIQFHTEFPNCIDSVKWFFNDPLQAPYDTSSLFNPEFQYAQSGSYEVRHISYKGGVIDTLYQRVYLEEELMEFELLGGGVICEGELPNNIILDGSESNCSYTLYKNGTATAILIEGTGAELDFGKIADAGIYTVTAERHASSCERQMMGTIEVRIAEKPKKNQIKFN